MLTKEQLQEAGFWMVGSSGRFGIIIFDMDDIKLVLECQNADLAREIVLQHNAGCIMLKRGWGISAEPMNTQPGCNYFPTGHVCTQEMHIYLVQNGYTKNPFTALVEGDRWYAENFE